MSGFRRTSQLASISIPGATSPGASLRWASIASHAASAAAIVVKYGMFASRVCRRSE